MKTTTERKQEIQNRKKEVNRRHRLWIGDGWRELPIYNVPVNSLVLNPDNRRFRVERMAMEERIGRQLDPQNQPDDERSIESLLLDRNHDIDGDRIVGKPSDDYEALKNDWLRRGQETPFWIRPDGTVRNGNRRLAMIKRLQREGGDAGLQWVDAVILTPEEIDEAAMLEIEQHEQLTENFKVRYDDMDYLLALRDAADVRDIEWFDRESIKEVSGELQTMVEKTQEEVERDLFAVRYMDAFLEELGQSGCYHRLTGTLERFRDIGRTMMKVEDGYPIEADQVLRVLFAAVRAGVPHQDIRSIRQMFYKEQERFNQLLSEITEAEEPWDAYSGPRLASPPPFLDAEDEEEGDKRSEGPGPAVPMYPKSEVTTAIKVAIDGFKASRQENVLQTLREIWNRLEVVSEQRLKEAVAGDARNSEAVRIALREIIGWAERQKSFLVGDD